MIVAIRRGSDVRSYDGQISHTDDSCEPRKDHGGYVHKESYDSAQRVVIKRIVDDISDCDLASCAYEVRDCLQAVWVEAKGKMSCHDSEGCPEKSSPLLVDE
jgi:hypothetical protein